MQLKNKPITINGSQGSINIQRNSHGIPVVRAGNLDDAQFALGWLHAEDRQLQAVLTRTILQGRAAELLKADDALLEIDRYMRWINFLPDPQQQKAALLPEVRRQCEAYAAGFNRRLTDHGLVWELKLLGCRPERWRVEDSLLIGKAFGFLGLADAQGGMEKLLVQMIQHGVSRDRLQELFPYLSEEIDYELLSQVELSPPLVPEAAAWLNTLPRFNASNNWAVSPERSATGSALLANDPHLEVNRIPSIWMEVVLRLPEQTLIGVSAPGAPGIILGRSPSLAWGATYSFMDTMDYRVERCRDGRYWRPDGWREFKVRREEIKRKKGPAVVREVFENEHGVLEGDPHREGHYLVQGWSGASGCGADMFNALLRMPLAHSVSEGMALMGSIQAASFCFLMADSQGNIGMQMSGRTFQRPQGVSGLLPLPGWETAWNAGGWVDPDDLPRAYNPPEGFICTANQDLNHLGKVPVINLPMGRYRAERIAEMLAGNNACDVAFFQAMHYDLFSTQARRFMPLLRPLLPDTPAGRTLAEWDLTYASGSRGATLFEAVYQAMVDRVFGDQGLGRAVVEHVRGNTNLLNDYYGNLDDVLTSENSAWFNGLEREELFRQAVQAGLAADPGPFGPGNRVMFRHLLFGGTLPSWLGFDRGPVELPGCRATIPQGQIFTSAGRQTTYSPSYRFIADLGTTRMHTNLAGGPSERRFSAWYLSDLDNWLNGRYKVLG